MKRKELEELILEELLKEADYYERGKAWASRLFSRASAPGGAPSGGPGGTTSRTSYAPRRGIEGYIDKAKMALKKLQAVDRVEYEGAIDRTVVIPFLTNSIADLEKAIVFRDKAYKHRHKMMALDVENKYDEARREEEEYDKLMEKTLDLFNPIRNGDTWIQAMARLGIDTPEEEPEEEGEEEDLTDLREASSPHQDPNIYRLEKMMDSFYPYAKEQLGFDKDAVVIFESDPENAELSLGKTGYYDPQTYTATVYITGRHPKDIMRSVAHELTHHTQNCRGENLMATGVGEQGYTQSDAHLRSMEQEAYEQAGSMGGLLFRDWEDGIKAQFMEAVRQKIKDKTLLNEGKPAIRRLIKENSSILSII